MQNKRQLLLGHTYCPVELTFLFNVNLVCNVQGGGRKGRAIMNIQKISINCPKYRMRDKKRSQNTGFGGHISIKQPLAKFKLFPGISTTESVKI